MKFKLNAKQIMLIVMCVLLVTVIIMTCVVIGKISSLFQSPDDPGNTTAPSGTTEPSTEPSTAPSTEPVTEVPTIPGHEHSFIKIETVTATCTSPGYSLYACSCGQTANRDYMEAKGHSFGPEKVFEGTCEEPGYTLKTCLRCGEEERKYEEEPKHDYQFTQTVTGSCTEDAYDEYVCSLCGDIKKENLVVAPGHNFSGWSPVDGEPEKEKRICVTCLEVEYRTLGEDEIPEITAYQNNDDPNWTHHILLVKYPTSGLEVTYDVWIGLDNRSITYDYNENGLMILYTVDGQTQTYTLPAKTPGVMTVYSDGTCVNHAPGNEPTDPTDPSEPSDPTDPSAPTETTDPTDSSDPTEAAENGDATE